MIRLQCCAECGASQYPSREFCHACLSDRLRWDCAESMPARVTARTTLHHTNEERFRQRLPLRIGLVRFDSGPVALCFLADNVAPGDAVQVRLGADNLLEAA